MSRMPHTSYLARCALTLSILAFAVGHVPAALAMQNDWVMQAINAPVDIRPGRKNKPLVVAIVDDGVRITHQDLAEFIWRNPVEQAGNYIDDDDNGYVDDINGWHKN
jgi:subtilisin family serine protease